MKRPSAVIVEVSAPLSVTTRWSPELRPVTVPPTTNGPTQETATELTLADVTVPVLPDTLQSCVLGCADTATEYVAPLPSWTPNVNMPLLLTVNESVPLSESVTDAPLASPDTVPPI